MKTVFFTVADKNHKAWAVNLEKSFKKFHPDIEFKIYSDEYVDKALKQDPQFFYKQKPWVMRELIKDYDLVVGMDADSIVTGSLDYILTGEYGVGVVNNFSNLDSKIYGAIGVFNIHPQAYINCGLVATTDKDFVSHWWEMCSRRDVFESLRYREQDLLNIITTYGMYNVVNFDRFGGGFYGLSGKDLWHEATMKKGELVVEFTDDTGKVVLTRPIKVIHVGGGFNPNKMSLDKYFNDEVNKYIKSLYE